MEGNTEKIAIPIEEQQTQCSFEGFHNEIDCEDSLYLIRNRNGNHPQLHESGETQSTTQNYNSSDGQSSISGAPQLSLTIKDTLADKISQAAANITQDCGQEMESWFDMLEVSDIKLLSFLLFCVNYGFSIEMVFISPFFFKVDTPDVLDTLIWLIPPFVIRAFLPIVTSTFKVRTLRMMRYRKLFILLFAALSIIGQLLMGFSRFITVNWISLADDKKSSIMTFGILGFIFQDVGHELIARIVAQYSEDSISVRDSNICQKYFPLASSSGMILAFLISSVLAFNIDVWDVQNFMENMTFSYCLGGVFSLIGFVWTFVGLKTSQQLPHELNESLESEYNLDTILPGFRHLSNMNLDQKVLVVSHFLMQGNLLLINVYATLWMGVTLQHSNLRYNVASNKVRDYLFDLGISWGALILCCASFLFYLSSRVQQAISQSLKTQSVYLCITNLALNLSFIYTYFSASFYCSCTSLLLWGIAQDAFDSIPFKLSYSISSVSKSPAYQTNQLLELSKFFSQILFWFVMPALFLFWDSVDDISFSLLQGSLLGTIGSVMILALNR